MERGFATCPPVNAVTDDGALASASKVVDQVAEDLRAAEAIANSLANLTGVTESALMVTCAAHVAFQLVRSALTILRAELDARLAAA
jgi:hypothetical protein